MPRKVSNPQSLQREPPQTLELDLLATQIGHVITQLLKLPN
jgi:hypothetical protein